MATIWDNIEIIGLDNNPKVKKAVEVHVEELARNLPAPEGRDENMSDKRDALGGVRLETFLAQAQGPDDDNPGDEMGEAAEALQARDENRAYRSGE